MKRERERERERNILKTILDVLLNPSYVIILCHLFWMIAGRWLLGFTIFILSIAIVK